VAMKRKEQDNHLLNSLIDFYRNDIGGGRRRNPEEEAYLPDNLTALSDDELGDLDRRLGAQYEYLVSTKGYLISGLQQGKRDLRTEKNLARLNRHADVKPQKMQDAAVGEDPAVKMIEEELAEVDGRWKLVSLEMDRLESSRSVVKRAISLRTSLRYQQRRDNYSNYPRADEDRAARRRTLPRPSQVKDRKWRSDDD
jgi:hypothetical protein